MQACNHFYTITLLGCGLLLGASNTHALSFQFDELEVDLQTSITAGVAIRGEDANPELIGKANLAEQAAVDSSFPGAFSVNGDDGNLAFSDSGDLFFAQTKFSSDLTIQWGDWGVFARGNYRYDPNIHDEELFSDFDYGPNRFRSNAEKRAREEAVEDAAGNDAELFDLYLFGNFEIGGRNASIRIGRQVLNWGESTFIPNGINSFVPVDARQARGPGAEVKEIFRPFGMAWGSLELTSNVSIEGFYQFDWEASIPDPSGTYFSTLDVVGAGSADVITAFGRCNENILAGNPDPDAVAYCPAGPNVPEAASDQPEDGGQYGVRLNIFMPWLNSTDFSLYAVNYHSRAPFFGAIGAQAVNQPNTARFLRVYPEDIELYGFSFNTFLESLGAAFQGEYSFKQDQPLQIDDVDFVIFGLGLPSNAPTAAFAPPALGIPADEATALFGPTTTFQTVGSETGQGDPARFGGAPAGERVDGFIRRDVHQWNFSLLKRWGPNWTGANATNLILEVAGQHIEDLPDPDVLPIDASATYVPNQTDVAIASGLPTQDQDGYADDFSWGYRLVLANTYNGVFNRFNLTPSLRFFHDVEGNSPGGVSTFLEDTKQVVLGLSGSYLDAWEAGLSYTFFFDSAETAASPLTSAESVPGGGGRETSGYTNNVVEDRDFFNMFVRYTF